MVSAADILNASILIVDDQEADLQMPVMDGFQVIEALKESENP